jgi:hypothetical protein
MRFAGELLPAECTMGRNIRDYFFLSSRWVDMLQEGSPSGHGPLALARYFVGDLLELRDPVIFASYKGNFRLRQAAKLGQTDERTQKWRELSPI